jgi:GT2 family glycosyltransferase
MLNISLVLFRNDPKIINKTLDCIRNCGISYSLCIVDNSKDNSLQKLLNCSSDEYILNPNGNVGFGGAHNFAFRKLEKQKYHLVLNPDVEFDSTVLVKMIEYLELNEDIGLLSPKILYQSGEIQYLCKRYPTILALFLRRFTPGFVQRIFSNIINFSEMRDSGYNEIMDVEYLSGCFMLLRYSSIANVGFFDEKFFLHFEDADLSFRIHKKFRSVFFPEVHIFHGWTRDSHKSLKMTFITLKSALYFFSKHGFKLF